MSNLSCEDVIRQLYAYLDGELETGEITDIDEHIHKCRECMGRADFERRLRNKIRETTDTSAPDRLRQKLLSILDSKDR